MKRLFLFLLFLAAIAFAMLPLALSAQSAGDFLFQKKSSSGPLAADWVTPGAPPALFGTTTGGDATSFVLGGGLAISGNTLSASGGVWGSITGTLASQTDLQTALDAKASTASLSSYLTTATAASTYASLSGSYANPAWLTSLAWSKLSSVPALLTTFAALGNPPNTNSVLGVDFDGSMEYWPVSNGPSGAADANKIVLYTSDGASRNRIQSDSALFSTGGDLATSGGITLGTNEWLTFHLAGGDASFLFIPQNVTDHRFNYLPDAEDKTFALTSQTDGTITASDVTGLAASATADTTNASNITSGSLSLSRLAQATATTGQVITWTGTAWAPATSSGGLPLTGGTMTGVLALPTGSVSAPAINFGSSGTGWYASAANLLDGSINGTRRFALSADKLVITGAESGGRVLDLTSVNGTAFFTVTGGGALFINGAAYFTGGEVRGAQSGNSSNYCGMLYDSGSALAVIRPSTTTLQIGAGASSPTAYLIRGASARAGTDSNASGAALGHAGGNSTGTGNGGDYYTATYMTGSSGSTANTLQTRSHTIARFINLTEGTATNVASIALASGKVLGGSATITVWASDGTDYQALTSQVRFSAVNKAGTITASASQTNAALATASAGTLTVTYDTSTNGNNVLLRANATSSLTETTLRCRLVITALNGDDIQTVTPQ